MLRGELIVRMDYLDDLEKVPKYEQRITLHSIFKADEATNKQLRLDITAFVTAMKKKWADTKVAEYQAKKAQLKDKSKEEQEEAEDRLIDDKKFGLNFRDLYVVPK